MATLYRFVQAPNLLVPDKTNNCREVLSFDLTRWPIVQF